MTNKEAIEYLKGQIKCLKCETGIDCEKCIMPNWSKEIEIEALNKGIEALENQSSVIEELEKIKAKIKQNQNLYYYNKKTDTYEDIIKTDTVMKVIDNHIEELKGE